MIAFLVLSPKTLVRKAQETYVDPRFVRDTDRYRGSIVLYHVVRHRPYAGSMTQWLKTKASAYERKHKGTFIEIEGMDEQHFYERLDSGRRPDAYSFFSGTLYPDRLREIEDMHVPYREGLFQTDRCIPYSYSGYCKLCKSQDGSGERTYYANAVIAARADAASNETTEDKADVLYLDVRRAGDLIRFKEGFALSSIEPIDNFTDAVCWIGVDRETDNEKTAVILDFIAFLTEPETQQSLNALGLFSVRNDVRNVPPEPILKRVFKTYDSVLTVDPFAWNANYDALLEDAALAADGDADARERFGNRLRECLR
ncbi:MAG: hypothetical protein IKZ44_04240 [Clostridia bacterium]|nr:hypothetical protein [Clostridia bacterium]